MYENIPRDAFFSQLYPLPTHVICLCDIHPTVMFLPLTRPYNVNISRTFPTSFLYAFLVFSILFTCSARRSAVDITILTTAHMILILSFRNCTASSFMFKGRSARHSNVSDGAEDVATEDKRCGSLSAVMGQHSLTGRRVHGS